jgi:hypothetical protein
MQKIIIIMMANQNRGIACPITAKDVEKLSMKEWLLNAEMIPNGMAMIKAIDKPVEIKMREAGNLSNTRETAGLSRKREFPKSPLTAFFK